MEVKRQIFHQQCISITKQEQSLPKLWTLSHEDEINNTAKETIKALQAKVEHKLSVGNAKKFQSQSTGPSFIKYIPRVQALPRSTGIHERIIQMQEMPSDPLEPPRHRICKIPRAPPDSPVPVKNSPPRAVDPKEAANWKIPPAISNWKNAKGYIIPLDKRLGADGRSLQGFRINDNFSKLAEALYIAEQKAREDTELRNRIAQERVLRDKEHKDVEMKKLALLARKRS